MVMKIACLQPRPSFSYKNIAKSVKCLFLYLKLDTTLKKIGTSTVHSNIIYLYSDPFNLSLRVNMCILIDYLSRHSFGHF